jgi:secretion system chaperone SscA
MDHSASLKEINDFLDKGGSMRALTKTSQDDLDQLYSYAYSLKEAGNYAAARNFFYVLVCSDHWSFDYWLGLGICCQHLGEHTDALFCFHQSGILKISDPRSSYLAGLTYQLMGKSFEAKRAFDASKHWCGKEPKYAPLQAQVERGIQMCTKNKEQR